MSIVTDLQAAASAQRYGGKAANLAQLMRLRLQIPPGFVVRGTEVELDTQDQRDVLAAFDKLGTDYVAVRSSAVNEDGDTAAWAGQLDTFLNIGRDGLVAHIEKCMRSNKSARAQAYGEQKHMAAGSVAVIVQAMIDSDRSGVAFSAHPVTGSRDQMVVEAGLGLGEAIVSGEITPDTYILNTNTCKVIEQVISTQTKRLARTSGGKTEWEILEPPTIEPKVTADQLQELVETVKRIAEYYDFPVDVEWAFANDALYILQARPITTL